MVRTPSKVVMSGCPTLEKEVYLEVNVLRRELGRTTESKPTPTMPTTGTDVIKDEDED